MSTKGKKWKRTIVLIETKIDALKQLDKGQSIKSVALDVGVKNWKRNRVQRTK